MARKQHPRNDLDVVHERKERIVLVLLTIEKRRETSLHEISGPRFCYNLCESSFHRLLLTGPALSAACAATHARSCQKIHLDIRTALRSAGGLVRVRRETAMPDKNGPLSGFLKSSQISQHVPVRVHRRKSHRISLCFIRFLSQRTRESATKNLDIRIVITGNKDLRSTDKS